MPYVAEDGKHEGPACMFLSVQVQKTILKQTCYFSKLDKVACCVKAMNREPLIVKQQKAHRETAFRQQN